MTIVLLLGCFDWWDGDCVCWEAMLFQEKHAMAEMSVTVGYHIHARMLICRASVVWDLDF